MAFALLGKRVLGAAFENSVKAIEANKGHGSNDSGSDSSQDRGMP